jgi:DNA-binding response OmpR family regulator
MEVPDVSKILLVDDDVKILGIFRKILEREGYEVIVADSGKLCLEMLETEKPDLIFMDVMMPDMDGWETVKKIRDNRSNKGIIISMLTVKSGDEDRIKSLISAHADWHLSKPVSGAKLIETAEWLLKNA